MRVVISRRGILQSDTVIRSHCVIGIPSPTNIFSQNQPASIHQANLLRSEGLGFAVLRLFASGLSSSKNKVHYSLRYTFGIISLDTTVYIVGTSRGYVKRIFVGKQGAHDYEYFVFMSQSD